MNDSKLDFLCFLHDKFVNFLSLVEVFVFFRGHIMKFLGFLDCCFKLCTLIPIDVEPRTEVQKRSRIRTEI